MLAHPARDDCRYVKYLTIWGGGAREGGFAESGPRGCTALTFPSRVVSAAASENPSTAHSYTEGKAGEHRDRLGHFPRLVASSCPPRAKFNYFSFQHQIINSAKLTKSKNTEAIKFFANTLLPSRFAFRSVSRVSSPPHRLRYEITLGDPRSISEWPQLLWHFAGGVLALRPIQSPRLQRVFESLDSKSLTLKIKITL